MPVPTCSGVALARELGPRMNNHDLAAALNATGHRTGTDRAFDATAAGNLRYACRDLLKNSSHLHPGEHDRQPGEASIAELAARLSVKPDVVYYWAQRGHIPTRRGSRCRLWIQLTDDLETQCQQRIADSYKHQNASHPQTTPSTERTAL